MGYQRFYEAKSRFWSQWDDPENNIPPHEVLLTEYNSDSDTFPIEKCYLCRTIYKSLFKVIYYVINFKTFSICIKILSILNVDNKYTFLKKKLFNWKLFK